MLQMIDIHNHLIPEFDDGPHSFDESLEMLRQAQEQGITDVFATSHFNEYIPREMEEDYFNKLTTLREEALAQGIRVNIYSGSEIFYHHYLDETVRNHRVSTLGGWGQYVLLEFPMFQITEGVEDVLFRLSVDGYIPIVAHPERYNSVLTEPEKALDFIRFGGLLQINAGSVLGHFGKNVQRIAMELLEQQVVHFIASDAHAPEGRTFILRECWEALKDHLPESYLKKLFYENPRNIIDEVTIDTVKLPANNYKKSGLLNKIKQRFKFG